MSNEHEAAAQQEDRKGSRTVAALGALLKDAEATIASLRADKERMDLLEARAMSIHHHPTCWHLYDYPDGPRMFGEGKTLRDAADSARLEQEGK